jgi:hypothetical protein
MFYLTDMFGGPGGLSEQFPIFTPGGNYNNGGAGGLNPAVPMHEFVKPKCRMLGFLIRRRGGRRRGRTGELYGDRDGLVGRRQRRGRGVGDAHGPGLRVA